MRKAAAALAILSCYFFGGATAKAAGEININIGGTTGTSELDFGITYTEQTLRSNQNGDAVKGAESIMSRVAHYQNLHIMGWGAPNPEPSPGSYDWSGLDRRMAMVRETRGIPVITLCCAPDWMKGGAVGETDWKRLHDAPSPEHFKDFAELVRQIALRYPDVKYYQVWNEFKGFWNRSEKRWDYEGYTQLYNMVYDTLKNVSADIKVGGPYTPMVHYLSPEPADATSVSGPYGTLSRKITNAFQYWLAHKRGADFITVDGHNQPKDGKVNDPFSALQYYADVDHWIHQQTNLPIWWAEWYSTPALADSIPEDVAHSFQNALMTATLATMAPDVSVALRWGPESSDQPPYLVGEQEGMWTSTKASNGGQPLPFTSSVENFERCFPRGQSLLATHASGRDVISLASPTCVLVINTTPTPVGISVGGASVSLDAYGVSYLPRH